MFVRCARPHRMAWPAACGLQVLGHQLHNRLWTVRSLLHELLVYYSTDGREDDANAGVLLEPMLIYQSEYAAPALAPAPASAPARPPAPCWGVVAVVAVCFALR
jgi:hypothetical protein